LSQDSRRWDCRSGGILTAVDVARIMSLAHVRDQPFDTFVETDIGGFSMKVAQSRAGTRVTGAVAVFLPSRVSANRQFWPEGTGLSRE